VEKFELQEILNTLNLRKEGRKLHEQINERFNRLGKKFDGFKVELMETQETADYLSSKVLQHEKSSATYKVTKLIISNKT